MADISWSEPTESFTAVSIVSAKPAPQVFVALGGARQCLGVDLHWVPELERSVPHYRTNCKWCHYPVIRKIYVPVFQSPLFFQRSILSEPVLKSVPRTISFCGAWLTKILEVPPSAFDLVKKLHRGLLFAVARGVGSLGKKVLFHCYSQDVDGIPPAFDVKPFLFKTWGIDPIEFKP